jgi:AcrR family transcriptional regulator
MAESRRRLSPDDRRNELLALGAEVFGQRPYDEVRIDEIAERAGVSRALMYHYFPDKRTFFAAVVRAEGERLFEATNTPPDPGQSLFEQVREGVLAYVRYDGNPTGRGPPTSAWAARIRVAGIEDDNDVRSTGSSAASPARSVGAWTPRSSATYGSPSTAGWLSRSRCSGSA